MNSLRNVFKGDKDTGIEQKNGSIRKETRIACSKATRRALKTYKREGEAYDTLIRRLLISGTPKPLNHLTDQEREWVLNNQTI